jgi:hypothetical protein
VVGHKDLQVEMFIEPRTAASFVGVFGTGRNEIVISFTDMLTFCVSDKCDISSDILRQLIKYW